VKVTGGFRFQPRPWQTVLTTGASEEGSSPAKAQSEAGGSLLQGASKGQMFEADKGCVR